MEKIEDLEPPKKIKTGVPNFGVISKKHVWLTPAPFEKPLGIVPPPIPASMLALAKKFVATKPADPEFSTACTTDKRAVSETKPGEGLVNLSAPLETVSGEGKSHSHTGPGSTAGGPDPPATAEPVQEKAASKRLRALNKAINHLPCLCEAASRG